ncbi:MAG: SMC-Scp complex subunit ScpB [Alphaproteobacteria bacterium]|nr:SMC-Scp complex subunit ScpB [Alphaproteobacteria bacterium]
METEIDEERPVQRDARYLRDKRIVEALLFASPKPLSEEDFTFHLGPDGSLDEILAELAADYAPRGVNLLRTAGKWAFRTAEDLGHLLVREREEPRRLSRAALETLSVIAYHQPVTRAEIEDIRGVTIHRGTIDVLMETGWIKMRGRRKSPGRPVTYGTTSQFLTHFGLETISDLPGLDDLKGAGFLDGRLPQGFNVPMPSDNPALTEDEDPLEEDQMTLIHEELQADHEPLDAGDDAGAVAQDQAVLDAQSDEATDMAEGTDKPH